MNLKIGLADILWSVCDYIGTKFVVFVKREMKDRSRSVNLFEGYRT
jgi:hypothetical protein